MTDTLKHARELVELAEKAPGVNTTDQTCHCGDCQLARFSFLHAPAIAAALVEALAHLDNMLECIGGCDDWIWRFDEKAEIKAARSFLKKIGE